MSHTVSRKVRLSALDAKTRANVEAVLRENRGAMDALARL